MAKDTTKKDDLELNEQDAEAVKGGVNRQSHAAAHANVHSNVHSNVNKNVNKNVNRPGINKT